MSSGNDDASKPGRCLFLVTSFYGSAIYLFACVKRVICATMCITGVRMEMGDTNDNSN